MANTMMCSYCASHLQSDDGYHSPCKSLNCSCRCQVLAANTKSIAPRNLWESNSVQFPRLLAEIHAMGLGMAERSHLCREMDITDEQLTELFERATTLHETFKNAQHKVRY